jgi:hypothetical protein
MSKVPVMEGRNGGSTTTAFHRVKVAQQRDGSRSFLLSVERFTLKRKYIAI